MKGKLLLYERQGKNPVRAGGGKKGLTKKGPQMLMMKKTTTD